jgi:hypothetical protein
MKRYGQVILVSNFFLVVMFILLFLKIVILSWNPNQGSISLLVMVMELRDTYCGILFPTKLSLT